MTSISDSVGDGGKNLKHDACIVQVMLKLIKDAKNKTYLRTNYDGDPGKDTKRAIRDYQTDKKLIAAKAAAAAAAGKAVDAKIAAAKAAPAAAVGEKLGLVTKDGATFKQMLKEMPAAFNDIRALENTDVVYIAQASTARELAAAKLTAAFRKSIETLAQKFHEKFRIDLHIAREGGLRSFQSQMELWRRGREVTKTASGAPVKAVTWVGPGESNHQWGRAVDFLPRDLKWLKADATFVTDTWWLNTMEAREKAKFNRFFGALISARDAIAVGSLGLFRLKNSKGALIDPPHLQSYNQSAVSMSRSLVKLLNKVGACKWKAVPAAGLDHYHCDLGFGGKTLYDAGRSVDIWRNKATITAQNIADAMNDAAAAKWAATAKAAPAKIAAPAKVAAPAKAGAPAKAPAPAKAAPAKKLLAKDITAKQLQEVQQRLKADWKKTEANWLTWFPTP